MCVTSGTATWPVRGCVRPGSRTTPSAPRLVTARPGMSAAQTSADVPCWSCRKHRREREHRRKGAPGRRIPEEARRTGPEKEGEAGNASSEFRRGRSERGGTNAPTGGQPTARLSQTQVTPPAPRPPAPHRLSRCASSLRGDSKGGRPGGEGGGSSLGTEAALLGARASHQTRKGKNRSRTAAPLPRDAPRGAGAAPRCSERSLLGGRSAPSQKSPVQLSLATHLGLVHK